MINTGYNNSSLKHRNRGTILRLLATGKCSSRIELARETGLSKMAASNVVSEFISEGIIEEKEKQKTVGKGRNPIVLEIAPGAPKILGVHISRNKCGVSLCDFKLDVLEERSVDITTGNPDRLFSDLFKIMDSVLEKHSNEKILGIGVGVLGPADVERGVILDPPDFFGMHNLDVLGMLRGRYDLPVIIGHEYDCATLAEKFFGAGRDLDCFAYVGISRGVGSGVIHDGRLHRSENEFNSELGHVSIDINGPLCSCGRRGCLETYISTNVLEEKFREATGEDLSFKGFCIKYKDRGPESFEKVFYEATEKFATTLTNAVNYTGNLNYILGHDGRYIPDRFVEDCAKKVDGQMMFRGLRRLKLIKSDVHNEVFSSTCACAILEMVFMGDMSFVHSV